MQDPVIITEIRHKFCVRKIVKGSSENRRNVNRKFNIVRIMQFELFQCQWTQKIYEIS